MSPGRIHGPPGADGAQGPQHARLASLDRQADHELATRTRRVAFVYVPVLLLLTFITDLRSAAPWAAAAVAALYALTGWLRADVVEPPDNLVPLGANVGALGIVPKLVRKIGGAEANPAPLMSLPSSTA